MFRDEIVLELKAGRGGDGLLSFRHERGAPKGGPDGGDGGRGGNIVLRARDDVNSLLRLGRRKGYVGGKGQPGGVQNMTGRDGADLVLDVPRGTQVFDSERGNLLRDLASHRQVLCVTHLPQVAALGHHHLQVQKQVNNNVTVTSITPLDELQRIDEVARMLGGMEITEQTLSHAKEMLEKAQA